MHPRNHGRAVYIHVDGAAFLRLFFLGTDHVPSDLAVRSLDEWTPVDIGTDSPKKVEMETKCPNCNNLVTAVWEPKKE